MTADTHQMVLYKRGFAGTIAEWLAATDYITDHGNTNVVLCERGIRTFETATRFTLDIAAVPVIHKQSLYPVCIDVSHPAGQRDLVPSLAKAAVAAGASSASSWPSCASWPPSWERRSCSALFRLQVHYATAKK